MLSRAKVKSDVSQCSGDLMESLSKWSLAIVLLFGLSVGSVAKEFPVSVTPSASAPPACADETPHKEMRVRVDSGVQLQVLDWDGADFRE